MPPKVLKVALPDGLRGWLEESAAKNGVSLSEQIRQSLEKEGLDEMVPAAMRDVITTMRDLMVLVRAQTGYDWWEAPDAFEIFCNALVSRLRRHRPKEKPSKPPGPVTEVVPDPEHDLAKVGYILDGVLFSRGGLIVEENPGMMQAALEAAIKHRDKGVRRRGKKMRDRT
jgi:hypothetical protein